MFSGIHNGIDIADQFSTAWIGEWRVNYVCLLFFCSTNWSPSNLGIWSNPVFFWTFREYLNGHSNRNWWVLYCLLLPPIGTWTWLCIHSQIMQHACNWATERSTQKRFVTRNSLGLRMTCSYLLGAHHCPRREGCIKALTARRVSKARSCKISKTMINMQ